MLTEYLAYVLNNVYLRFLLILVVAVLIGLIAKLIVRRVLKPLALKTRTQVDDLFVKSISSVSFYMVLAVGFKLGFQHFEFTTVLLNRVIDTGIIAIVMVVLLRLINNFAQHWKDDWAAKTESTADDRLIPLIEKILQAVVGILSVFFALHVWNVNITPLLGTAGLAGIALSFAVKDSLANIFGGIQLVVDKTFKVGDKVELESGDMGEILDVGLRSTKLRTYDNEVIYIPNGQLANARVKNFTVPDLSIRVNVYFGVEYGSDTEKVRAVIRDALAGTEGVLENPKPVVEMLSMSDSSLDFVARAWVARYTEAYGMKVKLTEVIYNVLGRDGIGIPFPTRTVYTKEME